MNVNQPAKLNQYTVDMYMAFTVSITAQKRTFLCRTAHILTTGYIHLLTCSSICLTIR